MASSFEKSRCFILPRVSFCPGLPYSADEFRRSLELVGLSKEKYIWVIQIWVLGDLNYPKLGLDKGDVPYIKAGCAHTSLFGKFEINWLVPLFPKNRKFVFLCYLFPNIVFVSPFPSKFGLCSPVPLFP